MYKVHTNSFFSRDTKSPTNPNYMQQYQPAVSSRKVEEMNRRSSGSHQLHVARRGRAANGQQRHVRWELVLN